MADEQKMYVTFRDGRICLEPEELVSHMSEAAKRALFRHALEDAIPEIIKKLIDRYGTHWTTDSLLDETVDDEGTPDGNWWSCGGFPNELRLGLIEAMPKIARAAVECALEQKKSAEHNEKRIRDTWWSVQRAASGLFWDDYLEPEEKVRRMHALFNDRPDFSPAPHPTKDEIEEVMKAGKE